MAAVNFNRGPQEGEGRQSERSRYKLQLLSLLMGWLELDNFHPYNNHNIRTPHLRASLEAP